MGSKECPYVLQLQYILFILVFVCFSNNFTYNTVKTCRDIHSDTVFSSAGFKSPNYYILEFTFNQIDNSLKVMVQCLDLSIRVQNK